MNHNNSQAFDILRCVAIVQPEDEPGFVGSSSVVTFGCVVRYLFIGRAVTLPAGLKGFVRFMALNLSVRARRLG